MKLLIAGGGTGGHLFPGIAVAEAVILRLSSPGLTGGPKREGFQNKNEVLFVGTKKGIEATVLPKFNFPLKTISISGLKGKAWHEKVLTFLLIPISIFQSVLIILKYKPDMVLGVGGYASFPVLFASFFLGKKRCIQEQNLEPGFTNKILSKLVHKIFISFKESEQFFPMGKTVLSGNPVRKFKHLSPIPHEQFTVFIFGGSQGAHSINRAVLDALPFLQDLKNKIHLIHQTGKRDFQWVTSSYYENNWKADIYEFIYDMDEVLAKSDYVICRAGASSVAELSLLGKACLFIPYPFAAHNHQELNAMALKKQNACRILLDWQLTGTELAKEIHFATENPRELELLREHILQFAHPYAAQAIVEEMMGLGI